ncbi:jg1652 [Pararge aegeria aegeria]|uniref:Jg1652 protein n=1 Tax=Pararge aegeria aegeria TaxID=348720 RepID=A0A8S4RBM2_9NEOP|nr:jg1652 [Pararge aegeria aegeria]
MENIARKPACPRGLQNVLKGDHQTALGKFVGVRRPAPYSMPVMSSYDDDDDDNIFGLAPHGPKTFSQNLERR